MSVVYFVASSDRVKIGTTTDFPTRIGNLRGTSPEPLETLALIQGGRETEEYLHERFAHLRAHSEWFRDCDEIRQFIELLNRRGRAALPHLGDCETAQSLATADARSRIVIEMAEHIRYLGRRYTAASDQIADAARSTRLSRATVERLRWKKIKRVPADVADAVRAAVRREKVIDLWRVEEEVRLLGLLDSPGTETDPE